MSSSHTVIRLADSICHATVMDGTYCALLARTDTANEAASSTIATDLTRFPVLNELQVEGPVPNTVINEVLERNPSIATLKLYYWEPTYPVALRGVSKVISRHCKPCVDVTGFGDYGCLREILFDGSHKNLRALENWSEIVAIRFYYMTANLKSLPRLKELPSLQVLDALGSRLVTCDWIEGAPGLRDLSLVRCRLEDISGLSNITSLESVVLDFNKRLHDVSPLSTLNPTRIWLNEIGSIESPAIFANCTKLEYFLADGTAFVNEDFRTFYELPNLKSCSVSTRYRDRILKEYGNSDNKFKFSDRMPR